MVKVVGVVGSTAITSTSGTTTLAVVPRSLQLVL